MHRWAADALRDGVMNVENVISPWHDACVGTCSQHACLAIRVTLGAKTREGGFIGLETTKIIQSIVQSMPLIIIQSTGTDRFDGSHRAQVKRS